MLHRQDTYICDSVTFLGDYEPEEKKVFSVLVKKGNTVLDIGANVGLHSLYFSELVGREGRVFSFEPVQQNYDQIVRNMKLNGITNIIPIHKGLSDVSTKINIAAPSNSNNPGAFNLFDTKEPTETVEVITGDFFIESENIKQVDFIKMDIEGYEYFAIKGLAKTLATFKSTVVFEFDSNYHAKTGAGEEDIFELFLKLNYRLYYIEDNGLSEFKYQNFSLPLSLNIVAIHSDKLSLPS